MHLIFVWLMFMVGLSFHILAKVNEIVHDKTNPVMSWTEAIEGRWITFLVRAFVATLFFGIFLSGELPTILMAANIAPWPWVEALAAVMNSAAAPFLAGGIGFAIDSALAFVPGLKSYIPEE